LLSFSLLLLFPLSLIGLCKSTNYILKVKALFVKDSQGHSLPCELLWIFSYYFFMKFFLNLFAVWKKSTIFAVAIEERKQY